MSETKINNGVKTINEIAPYVSAIGNCTDFTRYWILNNSSSRLFRENTAYMITPYDRYMAQKATQCGTKVAYKLLDDEELKALQLDSLGFPKAFSNMTDLDQIVCRMALNIRTSPEERERYKAYMYMLTEASIDYNIECEAIKKINQKDFKFDIDSYKTIYRARNMHKSWHPDIAEPSKEEKRFFTEVFEPEYLKKNIPGYITEAEKELALKEAKEAENKAKEEKEKENAGKLKIGMTNLIGTLTNVVSNADPATFPMEMLQNLFTAEDDQNRDDILSGIIDLTFNIFKRTAALKPDEIVEMVNKVPDNIVFDDSLTIIDGFKEFLETVYDYFKKIKNSDGSSDSVKKIVEEGFDDIKEKSKVFTNKKLLSMIKEIIDYVNTRKEAKEKKSEKAVPVDSDAEKVEVKQEEKPAAMTDELEEMFPNIYSYIKDNEGDIPSFCKEGDEPVNLPKSTKETPSIIADAMMEMRQENANGIRTPVQVISNVETDIKTKYPWVEQIAAIAAKQGISMNIISIRDPQNQICGIRFDSFNGQVFNYTKSFTIDLGYIIDNRTKLIFNAFPSGYDYLEKQESAFHVFDQSGKNLRTDFFEKLFVVGKDGFNDSDMKSFRMYNSNMMQLNRIIEFITVPTGIVKKEDRTVLKDSCFKMMRAIKDMGKMNGIDFGRFRMASFDKEAMTYVLSNENTHLCGMPTIGPRTRIDVSLLKDEKGKYKMAKDGKIAISFTVGFVDNVFDVSQLHYPTEADVTTITTEEKPSEDKKEETEVVDAEYEEVSQEEIPAIIQQ